MKSHKKYQNLHWFSIHFASLHYVSQNTRTDNSTSIITIRLLSLRVILSVAIAVDKIVLRQAQQSYRDAIQPN
jgi:hypothetical protein